MYLFYQKYCLAGSLYKLKQNKHNLDLLYENVKLKGGRKFSGNIFYTMNGKSFTGIYNPLGIGMGIASQLNPSIGDPMLIRSQNARDRMPEL